MLLPLLLLLLCVLLYCCCCYFLLLLLLFVIVYRMAKFGAGSLKLIPVFACSSFKRDLFLVVPLGSTASRLRPRFAYRLVQIERPKLCPREFLTPFFRVRPRNFAHIFWKAVSKTRRGVFFYLGFRCRDIRVLIPPRVKYSSRDPE